MTTNALEAAVLPDLEESDDECVSCNRCNNLVDADCTVTVGRECWCQRCADNYSSVCDMCGGNEPDDTTRRTGDGDIVCRYCAETHYYDCAGCDELYRRNELCFCEDSGCYYCESCYEERPGKGNGLINSYSYKPDPIFHGGKGIIHYGVELEIDCDSDYAGDVLEALGGEYHAYLKEDGSISDGFEIVSHPHTLDAHKTLWKGLLSDRELVREMDAYSNGMHVHIQRSCLSKLQLQKMVVFINKRDHAKFIEFMADRSVAKWAAVDPCKATFNYKAYCGERYTALNLCNARTAEVRIFRGTLDFDRLMANLQFCDALVTFCGETSCQSLAVSDFAAHVRKCGKRYRQLDDLLVSGGYLEARRKAGNPHTPNNTTEDNRLCA